MRSLFAVRSLTVLVALAACGGPADAPRPAEETRIYAAASLTDAIGVVTGTFDRADGGRTVASYGASNALAQQIHEGAAPGVFVSASTEWVDRIESWGLVEPGSRFDLAGNSLVVVVPRGSADPPVQLADLAGDRFVRIALADPVAVPAGKYAKAALERAGVYKSVRTKIVAAQDVRTAMSYVERGEAPVGIVYATDAAASPNVAVAFRVASNLHPKIVYPVVLVKGAGPRARALHAFLRTPETAAALERFGFTRP